jgi:hypothetical protein
MGVLVPFDNAISGSSESVVVVNAAMLLGPFSPHSREQFADGVRWGAQIFTALA